MFNRKLSASKSPTSHIQNRYTPLIRMYKSSSSSYIFKYFPLKVIVSIIWTVGLQPDRKIIELILLIIWLSCWAIFFIKRLKFATTRHDYIVIGSSNGKNYIEYGSIQWVYQSILIMPYFISIKYVDSKSGKLKKLLIMPSISSEWFTFNYLNFRETGMTKFIRKKAIEENTNYEQASEPSRLLPIGWWVASMVITFSLVPLIEFLILLTPNFNGV